MLGPGGRAAAAEIGAVEHVVVDEGRHVHELDRGAAGDGALAGALRSAGVQRKTSTGRSRLPPAASVSVPISPTRPGWEPTDALEPLLEPLEVGVEPGRGADGGERVHSALLVAAWRATMPPPSRRQPYLRRSPRRRIAAPSSSGPGKRRTLAGRYV